MVHRRGVEQWQLVGLITRRSLVRVQPPLPNPKNKEGPGEFAGAFCIQSRPQQRTTAKWRNPLLQRLHASTQRGEYCVTTTIELSPEDDRRLNALVEFTGGGKDICIRELVEGGSTMTILKAITGPTKI